MALVDEIKQRMLRAMKAKSTVEKEILRVALGEIQMGEARSGKAPSDEDAIAVVKKLVKSNEETLSLAQDAAQKAALQEELDVLRSLLPQTLGPEKIIELLAPVADAIRSAKSDGQATGTAMKHVKASGAAADGKDVAEAVKRMRAPS
jgi:uncharacterized protein YqeY